MGEIFTDISWFYANIDDIINRILIYPASKLGELISF